MHRHIMCSRCHMSVNLGVRNGTELLKWIMTKVATEASNSCGTQWLLYHIATIKMWGNNVVKIYSNYSQLMVWSRLKYFRLSTSIISPSRSKNNNSLKIITPSPTKLRNTQLKKLGWTPANKINTLLKNNSSPPKMGHPKRNLVFQPAIFSIFRCNSLVSGRANW